MSFFSSLTGGGGLSSSSAASSKAGDITVGGLTLSPPQNTQLQKIVVYCVVGVVLLYALKKGR
jgi:hypothetical protein